MYPKSPPAGNAIAACVSTYRFGEAKREMDTVDWCLLRALV